MNTSTHCVDKKTASRFVLIKTLISSIFIFSALVITSCSSDSVNDNAANNQSGTSTSIDQSDTSTSTSIEQGGNNDDFQSVSNVESNGLTVVVDATNSKQNDAVEYTYEWVFSDGFTSAEKITSHTFIVDGEQSATLIMTDAQGVSSSSTQNFVLTGNALPLEQTQILEGEMLYVMAGCANCHGVDGSGGILPLTFTQYDQASLSNIIELTMPVDIGLTQDCINQCADRIATWLLSIERTPQILQAKFIIQQNGLSISMSPKSSSLDPSETYQYLWVFSDKQSSNEIVTSHTFLNAGINTVTLNIINSQNEVLSTTQTFTMSGSVLSQEQNNINEGGLLYQSANCTSCHGMDGADGTTPLSFLMHTQLSLTDEIEDTMPKIIGLTEDCINDCASNIATWLLSIDRTPETLEAKFLIEQDGLSVSMSPKTSTLDPNETYQYMWSFSDNHTSNEIVTSHTFAGAGDHSVTLNIINSQNEVLSVTQNFILSGSVLSQQQQSITQGQLLYKSANCWGCHGDHGELDTQPILFENFSHNSMSELIKTTMPTKTDSSDECINDCADKIAAWLMTFKMELSCTDGITEVLPRRLRKLTNDEYVLTVNSLLNRSDINSKINKFGDDPKVEGYKNNAQAGAVTVSAMQAYWDAAKDIAESSNTASINQCSSNDMLNCADQFVPVFGLKAFRRPLTNDEQLTYKTLFAQGSDNTQGTQFVIQAMLSSTHFLYRTELGENGILTQYEVASLLSYTFLGSSPDDILLDKAKNNLLTSNVQLEEQASRLMLSPLAQAQFARFAQQWLKVESIAQYKDASGYPNYSKQLGEAMDEEFRLFMGKALTSTTTGVDHLFTADQTFVNSLLAQFYGFPNVDNNGFDEVVVNNERGGILNLAALLTQYGKTNSSNPIARGVMVRTRLLCQNFGPTPAVPDLGPVDANASTRDRFSQHSSNVACASCHDKIDDLGFGFEFYDGIGQYRTVEGNNLPVSDAGILRSLNNYADSDEHIFAGTNGLSALLATQGLTTVEQCIAQQFQIYMQGVEQVDDCAPADVHGRWNSAEGIAGLWIKSVSVKNFLNRQ